MDSGNEQYKYIEDKIAKCIYMCI